MWAPWSMTPKQVNTATQMAAMTRINGVYSCTLEDCLGPRPGGYLSFGKAPLSSSPPEKTEGVCPQLSPVWSCPGTGEV